MKHFFFSKALSASAISLAILFSGSALAVKPVNKALPGGDAFQPQAQVGDIVDIEGQVLEIQAYILNEAEIYRFMVSRPTIDGEPVRSAYLTACTGPTDEVCQANGFEMVTADGIALGQKIRADGEITMIHVQRYYATYFLKATSDIL
jgi:hypothetical protein